MAGILALTETEKLLQSRTREIFQLYDKSYQEVREFGMTEALSGTIYIGGGESCAFSCICRSFDDLHRQYPGIGLDVYSGDHIDVVEKLDKGLLDFGVLVKPADLANYDSLRLPVRDTWGILMRKDSPLAEKRR